MPQEIPPLGESFVLSYDGNNILFPVIGVHWQDVKTKPIPPAGTPHPDTSRYPTHVFVDAKTTRWDARILWTYYILPGPILENDQWDVDTGVQVMKFRQRIAFPTKDTRLTALAVQTAYDSSSIIASNVVGGLTIGDPGSGYTTIPTLAIDASPGGGTQATGTVTSLKVVSAIPANYGSGYVASDTITFTGGTFSTAFTATVSGVTLSTLALNAAGTGYTPNDVITLQGGNASPPATLVVNTTKVVSLALNAPGTGAVPGATYTLVGGTFNTAATLTISTTKVVSATVDAGGASGTPGTQTVTGTTGTGTKFTASVTVDGGGAISAVLSITLAGSYTVNPTDIAHEPVTGAGLVGAQLAVVMGVATFAIAGGGAYTVNSTTFTSTGGGNNATFQTAVFGVGTFTISAGGNYTTSSSTFTQQSVEPVGGLGATFQTATYTVLALSISNAGAYTVIPSSPTAQGSTSGAGTGLTAVLSFGLGSLSLTNAGTLYYYAPAVTVSAGNGIVLASRGPLVEIPGQTGYVRVNGYEAIDSYTGWLSWMASPTPAAVVFYWLQYVSIPLLIFSIQPFITCNKPPFQLLEDIRGGNSQLRRHRRTIAWSETVPTGTGNTYQTKTVTSPGRQIKFSYHNALCNALSCLIPLVNDGDCQYTEQYNIPATNPSASGFAGVWYTLGVDVKEPTQVAPWRATKEEFIG